MASSVAPAIGGSGTVLPLPVWGSSMRGSRGYQSWQDAYRPKRLTRKSVGNRLVCIGSSGLEGSMCAHDVTGFRLG
jgi:hypothetical protein